MREEVELVGEEDFVVLQVEAEEREGLDEGAAPDGDLGAPVERASTVEKRSKTRIGSSELSTVTDVPRRIRSVVVARPARRVSGAETA